MLFGSALNYIRACFNEVDKHTSDNPHAHVIDDIQITAFKTMIYEIFKWMQDNDLLMDDTEIDHDQLDRICTDLAREPLAK